MTVRGVRLGMGLLVSRILAALVSVGALSSILAGIWLPDERWTTTGITLIFVDMAVLLAWAAKEDAKYCEND